MPDVKYKTKDEMPEEFREHAKEADGGFVINLVPKVKLDEFRTNNVGLLQERDGLKGKHGGLVTIIGHDDPEKLKTELTELRTLAQKVKDGEIKGNDAIMAQVAERVAKEKQDFDAKSASLKGELDKANGTINSLRGELDGTQLNHAIAAFATGADSPFAPHALPDIQHRAQSVFKWENGAPVARDKQGQPIYSKKEAGQPLGLKEWGETLLGEAPHFGKKSAGGGASGGHDGGEKIAGMSRKDFSALEPATRMEKFREAQARR